MLPGFLPLQRKAAMRVNMMKKWFCFFAGCFVFAVPVFAQIAVEMDGLLNSNAVSYDQAAQFVLRAADVPVDPAEAFRYAAERDWVPKNADSGDRASLEGVSLLIMQGFGIKGGLFYNVSKSPHYAYRELTYKNVIQGRADSDMDVSGEFLLFMIGEVLSRFEDGSWIPVGQEN
jgi:hypothetical protein